MTFLQYHWDTTPPKNNILHDGSWSMMTTSQHMFVFLFILFCIVAFFTRNTVFGFMWRLVMAFFVALLAGVVIDRVKKDIVDLLKKD